jgi:hypothetical protein
MGNERHRPEGIIQELRQGDVLVGQGMARVDAIREVRIHVTEAVGQVCPGKGEPRPSPD